MDETELAVAMALSLTDTAPKTRGWLYTRGLYAFPRWQPPAVKFRRASAKRQLRVLMESDPRYWRPYWAFDPELGYDTSNVVASRDRRQQSQAATLCKALLHEV